MTRSDTFWRCAAGLLAALILALVLSQCAHAAPVTIAAGPQAIISGRVSTLTPTVSGGCDVRVWYWPWYHTTLHLHRACAWYPAVRTPVLVYVYADGHKALGRVTR